MYGVGDIRSLLLEMYHSMTRIERRALHYINLKGYEEAGLGAFGHTRESEYKYSIFLLALG